MNVNLERSLDERPELDHRARVFFRHVHRQAEAPGSQARDGTASIWKFPGEGDLLPCLETQILRCSHDLPGLWAALDLLRHDQLPPSLDSKYMIACRTNGAIAPVDFWLRAFRRIPIAVNRFTPFRSANPDTGTGGFAHSSSLNPFGV